MILGGGGGAGRWGVQGLRRRGNTYILITRKERLRWRWKGEFIMRKALDFGTYHIVGFG